jgi:hypothetical protein
MATKCGSITNVTRAVDCVQYMVTVCGPTTTITREVDCVQHYTVVTVCGTITSVTRADDHILLRKQTEDLRTQNENGCQIESLWDV